MVRDRVVVRVRDRDRLVVVRDRVVVVRVRD